MILFHKILDLSHTTDIVLDSVLVVILLYPCLILLVKRPYLFQVMAREHTEAALSASESRFRMILENFPYLMAVRDEDGVVLMANKKYAEFYGTTDDRIIGVPLKHLHEAAGRNLEELSQALAADQEVIASGLPKFCGESNLEWNGDIRWFRVSRIPVTTNEGRRVVLMIAGEMTRQIKAEESIRISHENLERCVEEQTAELEKANNELKEAISSHVRAEEALYDYRTKLQNLSAGLLSLLEEERTRISREMHDELGQSLTALKFDLSEMGKNLSEGQTLLSGKTASLVKQVESILETVKKISRELRPGILDDLGLPTAIEWQAKQFHERTKIPCRVSLFPRNMKVNKERSTVIFRIFQEALTNVVRHACATRVETTLENRDGLLILEVRDNGRGISHAQVSGSKSLGLIGIRERVRQLNGDVLIEGSPSAGTLIRVAIPATGTRQDVALKESMEITA